MSHFNYSYARWILFLPFFFSIKIRKEGVLLTTVSKMGGEAGERGEKNRNQAPPFVPVLCPGDPDLLMGGLKERNALWQAGIRGAI